MHLKRRLTSVVLVVAMVALTIWGSQVELPEVSPMQEEPIGFTSQKETLYFWYTDDSMTNYINNAAVNFGKTENVRIIPVLKECDNLLDEINRASLDSHEKQFPDMYLIDNNDLEKAYLSGLAGTVNDLEQILNEEYFPKTALSAVTYRNHLVGYPLYYETSALLYNKTYLELWKTQQENKVVEEEQPMEEASDTETEGEENNEEAVSEIPAELIVTEEGLPKSIEGILHVADNFEAPEGVEGVFKWAVSDIFFNYWFVGKYLVVGSDSGDDKSNIDVNNEQTKECLQVYQDLNQYFSIESNTVHSDTIMQDFIEGKMVFTIASTGAVKQLEEATKEGLFPYEYGIATLPDVSLELQSRALSVTSAVAINGYSMHQGTANRFAAYLTNTMADELYIRTGKVSGNKKIVNANKNLDVFFEEYSKSVSLPKMMEIGNLWLQLEALFAKVWNSAEIAPLLSDLETQIATQINIS